MRLGKEITDELSITNDKINSYKDFLLKSYLNFNSIETTNGYGIETNEYDNTYLRDCLNDETCVGYNGTEYRYDERKNYKYIFNDNKLILSSSNLSRKIIRRTY